MSVYRKTINILGILALCLLAQPDFVFAKQLTRNHTVKLNKPEVVYEFALLNARFEKEMEKCQQFWAPTIVLRRKPKIGKVKIRKGVKFDTPKNSVCKGKKILGTTVEYTGTKRGKDSFKVEVMFSKPRYYEEKFHDVTFNINVR